MAPMTDIAIVGGGASGTLLALRLMRTGPAGLRVTLIDQQERFARGIAYATADADHLLNTPMDVMSVDPDDAQDFARWAAANGHDVAARFMPRQAYGDYLQAALADAVARGEGRLHPVADKVVGLSETADGARLALRGGATVDAAAVVLATGHRPPSDGAGAFRGNPWAGDALEDLDPLAAVLLIGTGLTMIDLVISLLGRGHAGRITALSRRGLLPRQHVPHGPALPEGAVAPLFAGPLSARLARFRAMAGDAPDGWEPVMHALRPRNQALWGSLDTAERRRFLRHLRPWWDVYRHRVAPAIGQRIAAAIAARQLSVVAGRVSGIDAGTARVAVTITRRGSARVEHAVFGRVIDCRGPRNAIDLQDALQAGLRADGLIRPDALGLGLDVDAHDALVGAAGRPSARLFALGPPTRGRYWEITAIPDIRAQAARLAAHLVGLVAPARR